MKLKVALSFCFFLMACSQNSFQPQESAPTPGVLADDSVVRGVAVVEVVGSGSELSPLGASTGTTTVVYTNAAQVTFEIDPTALVAGAMTDDILSLGRVSVTKLKDNNLNLCGTNGNQKCTTAEIRVYTTGTVAGFVNISDIPNYGVPVFVSGLNPTTAVTLGSPGIAVQRVTGILPNKHNLKLSDFPSPSYDVTADFREGGSGSYKMTFVVEYALKP